MKSYKIILILSAICLFSSLVFGQPTGKKTASAVQTANPVKATPAYAELLLRKAELESDIESFLVSYTEEYPKLKESRYELSLLDKDLTKLLAQTDASRLTLALGKLLVRKNQLETDLWGLQNKFGKDHPEVKRASRKVASFQNAIKEILP
jgi:hypothetical protein